MIDDPTAIERQIAAEMLRRAGPVRPVDDVAILAAVTASNARSSRWRVRPIVRAGAFVAAGGIVALAGGMLLTGVLMPRPHPAPAVGTPASPSPPPTASPVPTIVAARSPWVDASDLPGIAVTTEFIRPFRYTLPSGLSGLAIYEDREVFTIVDPGAGSVGASPRLFGGMQATAAETEAHGILVADVTGTSAGTCTGLDGPSYQQVSDDPEVFFADLLSISGLRVEALTATTLGGRPAIAASTVLARCGASEIIVGSRPIWEAYARLDIPSRILVARVGTSTVMAQVWAGTPLDLESWLSIAQQFIDSIEFLDPVEASSAPASTSSPPA